MCESCELIKSTPWWMWGLLGAGLVILFLILMIMQFKETRQFFQRVIERIIGRW